MMTFGIACRTSVLVLLLSLVAPAGTAFGVVSVLPTVETDPSHHSGDTADDAAIWIHPTNTSLSLIIGDDKDGGLMVYGLDGRELQYVTGTNYNNLDLRYNFPLAGQFSGGTPHQKVALIGVGDETNEQVDFFKVNPATRRLESAGSITLANGLIPYGSCMYFSSVTGKYYYFVNAKSGVTHQYEIRDGGGGTVVGSLVRQFDVGSRPEGCVADDVLGKFYIGEETVGIWKYGAEPGSGSARTQVDHTGSGGNLTAEVEGLSIYYVGNSTGYLIASSQGSSTCEVYERTGSNAFLGSFRIVANGAIDAVSATDGLDVTNFPLGSGFAKGLFVAHDASNSGGTASNYKFVPWESIATPLGLTVDTTWDPRLMGASVPDTIPPPPSITSFTPTSGPVGTQVTVQGSHFTGVTAVSFNGTAASSFTVDSDTSLRATVAVGTTTGTIRVTNGAGSAVSGSVFTVTAGQSQLVLSPTDDTRVDASRPTASFGTSHYLQVENNPTHHSYLKFNVTGVTGPVQSAKVRLYCVNESTDGGGIFTVSNNYLGTTTPWVESGVTWNNAPTIGGTPLDQKGAVARNTWVEFNVTPAISGNGIYSFGLSNGVANSARYSTTEGQNPPELVLQVQVTGDPSPSITSFAPASGPVGTQVTVQGSHFTGVTAVSFNGTAASSFTVDSGTALRATVAAGTTTGTIRVTNPAGSATSASSFTVLLLPSITSFAPASGPVGTEVTVQGSRFTGVTAVSFNGTPASSFTVDSGTALRATVAAGTTTGPIRVTTPEGTATSTSSFTVLLPPSITSFTPASGPVGTQVTVQGSRFTGVTAVSFNGTAASSFTVDSGTSLRATVAAGTTTGTIRVTNGAGSAVSGPVFTVTTGSSQLVLIPTHDTRVDSSTPTRTYGTDILLRVKGPSPTSATHYSYLKFNVTGVSGTVQSAKVRLYVTDESNDGGGIYTVSNNYLGTTTPWVESGVTWNNAPTIGGTPLDQKGAVVLNTWVEFDVTAAITGNGIYNFGLMSVSPNSARYASKEDVNPPELVIQVNPAATPPANLAPSTVVGNTPRAFALRQSRPNPFRARTSIRFELPRPGKVRLTVYDVMGRAIKTVVDGHLPAGEHAVPWDARDNGGSLVSSGVYLVRIEAEGFTSTRKLLRMR